MMSSSAAPSVLPLSLPWPVAAEQPAYSVTSQRPDAVLVAAEQHAFDVIAANDQRVQAFDGIGSMRIELDFSIA